MASKAKRNVNASKSSSPARPKVGTRFLSQEGARRLSAQAKRPKKRYHEWLSSPKKRASSADRLQPFTASQDWRIFRIMAEFIDGFEFLDRFEHEVSIFGSARATPKDEYYQLAQKLGYALGKDGYTVITGGGPGIMEAGNRGAFEAGGESVGLDIELPTEQRRNQFVTRAMGFHHFFTRKVMLSASSQAYIFFPGGFGTLDEMSEMITLIQTGKIPKEVPCILMGRKFWAPFVEWVTKTLYGKKYIEKKDIALMHVVDTVEEAMKIIHKTHERPYGSHMTGEVTITSPSSKSKKE